MNILHVDTEMGWRGGEQQVAWLVEGLLARGMGRQVIAANPASALERHARAAGWDVAPLRMRGGWNLSAARELARIATKHRIDLVHAHTAHAHTLAWLGIARNGIAAPEGETGANALRSFPPVVVTRRVDFPIATGIFASLRRAKYLHPRIALIAISRGVRDVLVQGGVPAERIHLVHSAIDPSRLDSPPPERRKLRAELGIPPDKGTVLIGNVAALSDHKGQVYLIQAAARLRDRLSASGGGNGGTVPDFLVAIAGEGEERPRLESEIERLRLADCVRLLGHRRDVPDCLAAFDIFCMPSHLEGLGTSILDAMWMRLPVVAARAGGIPDVIEDRANGLLVPPRDPEALARALETLFRDAELRRRLGESGRRTIEKSFLVHTMVEGTLRVYEKALGPPRAASKESLNK